MFEKYLNKWNLKADGEPILTHSSQLLPVRFEETPAMLKIARSDEEKAGALLMIWWNGEGAAPVLQHEGDAILMERALAETSLIEKVYAGQDDEASRIICSVAAKLHAHKGQPPGLIPLSTWFRSLEQAAKQYEGIFKQTHVIAKQLLNSPEDIVVLHGDIHHGNILDFGERGWLAIDPKHILGERGYDFANLFCNPDQNIATQPGRLIRQVQVVAEEAQLDHNRLLQWIAAYAGLSAAWSIEDGEQPELAMTIAELAVSLL